MTTVDKTTARIAVLFLDGREHLQHERDDDRFGSFMSQTQQMLQFAVDHPQEAREILDRFSRRQPTPVTDASREASDMLFALWTETPTLEEVMAMTNGYIERWLPNAN